jgi:hypothetical protein
MHGLRSKPIESACRALVPYEPNWHAIVGRAIRELTLVRLQILGEAEALAAELNGAVRHKLTRQLISRARTAGFEIGDAILKAAGFTPASFWAILDAPLRLAVFIQLLMEWTFDPREKVGAYDPETRSGAFDTHTATHWRLFQALKVWIESGRLDGKLDGMLDGRPDGSGYLADPREAVRLLMTSPPHRDLVPACLAELPVAEPLLPDVSEPAQAQPAREVSDGELTRWIKIAAPGRSLKQLYKLAETRFPGRHVSKERIRLAVKKVDPRPRGHPLGKGKTRPSARPKS